ncbi:PLP-dependent transferase, partial [Aureobasidium melanogenum]
MAEATLSERGRAMAQTSLKARLQPILSNVYHPQDNPNGIVDMGTAENHIMTKDVSDFANTKIRTTPRTFTYGEGPWGSKRLRTAMADHMNKYFHPVSAIQPDELVFANGITSLCELFGYAIASPNDGILISRPSYQAFPADFGAKAGLKCVNFHPFLDITTCKDEWAAEEALAAKMEHNGIYITKGSLLQAEQAGWFRIIFAQEDDVINEGFKRLFNAIGARKVEVQ